MKPHRRFARYLFSLALLAIPAGLSAQDIETLRDRWRIDLPQSMPAITTVGGIAPGTNTGSQAAFGVAWGQGFVGLGYQERARYVDEDDATLAAGIGIGDPRRFVGLEVAVTSSSTIRSMPFEEGFLNLKLHRSLPAGMAIAAGVENVADWGDDENGNGGPDADQSYYGVLSKVWDLHGDRPFDKITTSVGVGSGRFQSEDDVLAGEDGIGVFGALAVQVVDEISLIADWTGQDLGIGASFAPFQNFPLVITPAVMDVTESAGDGARFIVGMGLGFEWADLFN